MPITPTGGSPSFSQIPEPSPLRGKDERAFEIKNSSLTLESLTQKNVFIDPKNLEAIKELVKELRDQYQKELTNFLSTPPQTAEKVRQAMPLSMQIQAFDRALGDLNKNPPDMEAAYTNVMKGIHGEEWMPPVHPIHE